MTTVRCPTHRGPGASAGRFVRGSANRLVQLAGPSGVFSARIRARSAPAHRPECAPGAAGTVAGMSATPRVRLAVIGGGKMGEALLGGLLASGWARPEELVVVEPVAARRAELASLF